MSSQPRILFSFMMIVGLGIGLAVPPPAVGSVADDTAVELSAADNRGVANHTFLSAMSLPLDVPVETTADETTCDPGVVSDRSQAHGLAAVNYVRDLAGLDPVTFDKALSAKAQQAALIMRANRQLNHYPPSTWTCYTPDGAWAAARANLGYYTGPARTPGDWIVAYMTDSGDNNTSAGHRVWILTPETVVMGSGSTPYTNALIVLGSPTNPDATDPGWLPWPTPGYFPSLLEPAGRWSLVATDESIDLRSAAVTVRGVSSGDLLPTRIEHASTRSLVWHVDGVVVPRNGDASRDRSYRVAVSGILRDGVPVADRVYTTTLFRPRGTFTWTTPPSITGSPVAGRRLWLDPGVYRPLTADPYAGAHVRYRWYRDGTLIPGEQDRSLRLTPGDVGHRVTARFSPYFRGLYTGAATTASTPRVSWAPAPRVVTPPVVLGRPRVGNALRVTFGTWKPGNGYVVSRRWRRDGKPIPRATRNYYWVRRADRGHRLTVRVVYRTRISNKAVVTTSPVTVRR